MRKNNWKHSKSQYVNKMYSFETEHKIYCNCDEGHHGVVFYNIGKDRLICNNCGHWIYKDKKTRLKYKMKERGINII